MISYYWYGTLVYLPKPLTAICSVLAEEMDWDKNGMVNFKEFLFAFTRWVGIEDNDDDDDDEGA